MNIEINKKGKSLAEMLGINSNELSGITFEVKKILFNSETAGEFLQKVNDKFKQPKSENDNRHFIAMSIACDILASL